MGVHRRFLTNVKLQHPADEIQNIGNNSQKNLITLPRSFLQDHFAGTVSQSRTCGVTVFVLFVPALPGVADLEVHEMTNLSIA
jgi:hypothetical protein